MKASFEERSVWIQLVSVVAILGGYFVVAGLMLSRGVTALPAYAPLFFVVVVLLVVVLVAGHVVMAVTSRHRSSDERDRLIGWRAESRSSWVLGAAVIMGITGLVLMIDAVWIAHWLLLGMFLSEVLKLTLQLVYYRRGIQA
jgi:general stress protein CsbA